MKHLLLLCLGFLLAFSLHADEMYLGYCDGEVSNTSFKISGKNKTIQCAIRVPAANVAGLVGNNITKIRVGVNTDCPKLPSSVTVWIRTSNTGQNLAEKKKSVNKGWNDIELDAPLAIPEGQDLWIGYSYQQASTELKINAFAGNAVDGCSYWYHNGSMAGWADHSLDVPGALSLEAVVEGDNLPQHDLSLLACVPGHAYVKLGTSAVIVGAVRNNAVAPAEGFEVAYSVNNGAVSDVVSFDNVVNYRKECSFEFEIPTDNLEEGMANVDLEVRWKNGIVDDYAADNTGSLTFATFTQGYLRNVLLEEFTTENCGYCPMGIKNINNVLDTYNIRSSVVWVCHHHGYGTDFLTVSESGQYTQMYGTGGTFAPAMMVDRTKNDLYSSDGVIGSPNMNTFYVADWLMSEMDKPAMVGVEILSATCTDNEIKIRVRAEKSDAFDAITTAPRLNVWIKESGIPMRNQSDYTGDKTGIHNHALRKVLTATWGDTFTWDGSAYEAEYTCPLSSAWVLDNLEAVAFISRYSSDIYQREVYNSAECRIVAAEEDGISHIAADAPAQTTTYSVDGRIATGNAQGITIRQTMAADGSVKTEKVMK